MNATKKTITGLVLVAGVIAAVVMLSRNQGSGPVLPPSAANPAKVVAAAGVQVGGVASGSGQANISPLQSKAPAEAQLFKALPDLIGMSGPQRMSYLANIVADRTNSYLAKYKNPVDAMSDLVRLGKSGDIGATLAAQRIANRCADAVVDTQTGHKTYGVTIAECQRMSKDDLNAIPALMVTAAGSGDAMAKYVIMNYSNHFSGAEYMQTFLHDPTLLASFQQETLKAHEYFEPLANEAVLGNISQTFKNGNILPADPIMEQAYMMAAYTIAATHVPQEKIAYRLTGPNSINEADGRMTQDQRNAALRMAQVILDRCCGSVPLPAVLLVTTKN